MMCSCLVGYGQATGAPALSRPVMPTGCFPVSATKYIFSNSGATSVNNNPWSTSCTGGPGFGHLYCTGAQSWEPSQSSGSYMAAESSDYTAVYTNGLATHTCVELVSSGGMYGFVLPPMQIPSGKILEIDPGIRVFKSRNLSDFTSGSDNCGLVSTSSSCIHWITSPNSTNSGIMGYGMLDARAFDAYLGSTTAGFSTNKIQAYGNTDPSGCAARAAEGYPVCSQTSSSNTVSSGPNTLNLVNTTGFKLYEIWIANSAQFNVNIDGGSGFFSYGVNISDDLIVANTDGEDPLNHTNGTITGTRAANGTTDCSISTGDNQVSLKSKGSATANTTVSNCNTYAGIGIVAGTDQAQGISNWLVTKIRQNGNLNSNQSAGLGIGSSIKNGGAVSNLTFSEVCMQNEYDSLRFFSTYGSQSGSDTPSYTKIRLNDIHVLSASGGNSGYFTFQGLNSGHPIGISSMSNLLIDGNNQGVDGRNSPNSDQYVTAALSGYIDPSIGTSSGTGQFGNGSGTGPAAGPGVSTTGTPVGSPTWAIDPCVAMPAQPLIGKLVMKTPTFNMVDTSPTSLAAGTSITLIPMLRSATAISAKESPANPSAKVTLLDNGSPITTTVALGVDGTVGSYAFTPTAGTHVYTAQYPGDSNYPGTFTFGSLTVNVGGTPPTSITATPVSLTVNPTLLTTYLTAPASPTSLTVGSTLQFSLMCHYSSGPDQDCTGTDIYGDTATSFTSSNTSFATIMGISHPNPGLASAVAAGSVNLTAAANHTVVTPNYPLTVNSAAVSLTGVSLATTGGVTGLLVGSTNQLIATCLYSDSSTTNCTTTDNHGNVANTYVSTMPAHATVNATSGLATGVAAGATTFSATAGGHTSAALPLTVSVIPPGSYTITITGPVTISGTVTF